MNIKYWIFLFLFIHFFSISAKPEIDDFSFRFVADFNAQPFFYESLHTSNSFALTGKTMAGFSYKRFSFGLSIHDTYRSFGIINQSSFYGAENTLRFAFDFYIRVNTWLELQSESGVSLLNSSFVYNNAINILKQEAGLFISQTVVLKTSLKYLSKIELLSQIDFFIHHPYYTPQFYGGARIMLNPNLEWFSLYIEAGGVPFVYSSNDISFVSGMFIFAVGIQTDVTLGDIIREAQIVKYNKRQAVFKKMDQYDQLKQVEKGDIVSFTNIRFAPDSDVILEESYFILDTIAKSLIERPDLLFEIGGYTNATGFPDKEKQLSLQRAQKVVAYFYSRGVELFRMKAVGYGSLGGVLGQVNQDNRKVEIKVIEIIRKSQSR